MKRTAEFAFVPDSQPAPESPMPSREADELPDEPGAPKRRRRDPPNRSVFDGVRSHPVNQLASSSSSAESSVPSPPKPVITVEEKVSNPCAGVKAVEGQDALLAKFDAKLAFHKMLQCHAITEETANKLESTLEECYRFNVCSERKLCVFTRPAMLKDHFTDKLVLRPVHAVFDLLLEKVEVERLKPGVMRTTKYISDRRCNFGSFSNVHVYSDGELICKQSDDWVFVCFTTEENRDEWEEPPAEFLEPYFSKYNRVRKGANGEVEVQKRIIGEDGEPVQSDEEDEDL